MIRGMSYNKGVFFMNKAGIAHATQRDGKVVTHYFPFGLKGYLFLLRRLLFTLPLYIPLIALLLLIMIEQPKLLFSIMPNAEALPKLPDYTLILFVMAYHFIFPMQLRKYHGAEHKVFSYRGRKHLSQISDIGKANIVNRHCSTNAIVLFFLSFFLSFPFVNGWLAVLIGFLAIILIPRFWTWGDQHIIYPISAFLQKKITTAKPDEIHLKVAILSYMSLQAKKALTEEQVWTEYNLEQERIKEAEEERLKKAEEIIIERENDESLSRLEEREIEEKAV